MEMHWKLFRFTENSVIVFSFQLHKTSLESNHNFFSVCRKRNDAIDEKPNELEANIFRSAWRAFVIWWNDTTNN